MNSIQKKVNVFNTKYNLGGSVEARFIDLSSEVGELGKEILEGTNYGEKAHYPGGQLQGLPVPDRPESGLPLSHLLSQGQGVQFGGHGAG